MDGLLLDTENILLLCLKVSVGPLLKMLSHGHDEGPGAVEDIFGHTFDLSVDGDCRVLVLECPDLGLGLRHPRPGRLGHVLTVLSGHFGQRHVDLDPVLLWVEV